MPLLFMLAIACSPTLRMPGPLGGLGGPPTALEPGESPGPGEPGRDRAARDTFDSDAIVRVAQDFVGKSKLEVGGTRFRYDCSGLVEAVMAASGGDYAGSSAMMYERARDEGVLRHRRNLNPGDLVFFDDTYDRNGNGRRDDALSHIAVVETVAADDTATLIHLGSRGVVRIRMNLRDPDVVQRADGEVINDYLRGKKAGDSPRTAYLAGELWAGTATVAPNPTRRRRAGDAVAER